MPVHLFGDAAAASTCASPITAVQTTVVLASTAGFPVPSAGQQFSVVVLDAGAGNYSAANPLATNYEYQPVTGNNTGTNTLTFGGGVRAAYAGTTPKAYSAGAQIALTLLAEDLLAAFARIDQSNPILPVAHYQGGGSSATLGALASGISTQSIVGTDAAGQVTVTTSGSPPGAAAGIAVVNFAAAWANVPSVQLTPANNQLATYSAAPGTTSFTIITNVALSAAQSYKISYFVCGAPN